MIPYYFHKLYNFNSKLLSYKNEDYPSLEKYCKGLDLIFVKEKGHHINRFDIYCEKSILKYLILNSKKIRFLNLLHKNEANIRSGVLYKILNRKGFLYLKFDAAYTIKDWDFYFINKKIKYNGIIDYFNYQFVKFINRFFFKVVDLMSIETKELHNYLSDKYPKFKEKLIFLPNGIDDLFIKDAKIKRIPYKQKDNIILTVGRLGNVLKCNEILLEAISKIENLKDWKVYLVGPIEEHFYKYINNFFEKNSHLRENIIFTGEIKDRKKLFELYNKSKIYCCTSKYESFGISLIESAYFGNYIVSSNFISAREITENGTLGHIFEPCKSDILAEILQNLINNEKIIENLYLKIIKHAEKKYSWSNIITKLFREIVKRIRLK